MLPTATILAARRRSVLLDFPARLLTTGSRFFPLQAPRHFGEVAGGPAKQLSHFLAGSRLQLFLEEVSQFRHFTIYRAPGFFEFHRPSDFLLSLF